MRVWYHVSASRNAHFKLVVYLLILLAIILVEEINVGTGFVSVMNYYGKEVLIPITTRREITVSIAIVIVVADLSNKEQYQLAQDTVSCFATYHRYPLHFVNVADNSTLTEVCPQKDFMFKRHCVVAHMMSSWQEEWLLFVDADMAIINPNHLIEEYIPSDPAIHVVFYNRIFNHEVMAGSYLIRRSNYSYNFLMHWSNYEFKLPQSFHGSDNGAIHSAIVSYELPARESARNTCEQFWMAAKDYDTLSIYEVCMQMILSPDQLKHILILPKVLCVLNCDYQAFYCIFRRLNRFFTKGSLSWARDGWLTNSVWSNRDFILHGWQKRRKDRMRFARWHSPLVDTTWNSALCEGSNAYFNWRYKDSFINKNEEIQRKLDVTIRRVAADFDSIKERI